MKSLNRNLSFLDCSCLCPHLVLDPVHTVCHSFVSLVCSPKIFQKTKCSICNSALELPSVHFLCGHSFHQHCFESYSESDADCPTCLPENRKVMDMIRAQEQKRDLHDQFQHQVGCGIDVDPTQQSHGSPGGLVSFLPLRLGNEHFTSDSSSLLLPCSSSAPMTASL